MNEILLARVFQHVGEIIEVQARIEAMKAENEVRKMRNEALAYTSKDFDDAADEILGAINDLRFIGYGR